MGKIKRRTEEYVIGDPDMPLWASEYLMAYRRDDGTTGYELWGYEKVYELQAGDKLIWNGERVSPVRIKSKTQ